jgi:predicted membrane protein
MSILSILLALVVAGVVLWLVNTYVPMDRKIKSILNVVVVILVILWLLNAFGVLSSQPHMHMSNWRMGW